MATTPSCPPTRARCTWPRSWTAAPGWRSAMRWASSRPARWPLVGGGLGGGGDAWWGRGGARYDAGALGGGRRALVGDGLIHHSDRGAQFPSLAFGSKLQQLGIRASMGSVGDCFDHALIESFFATLECELIDRRHWRTREEARLEVFWWLEAVYNRTRRHSSLGYLTPTEYEARLRITVSSSDPSKKE